MRSFLAIDIPKEVKNDLFGFSKRLKSILPNSASWVKGDNFHITLCFLGEVEENFLSRIKEPLELSLKHIRPFLVSLGQFSFMPLKKPRILYVDMLKGSLELKRVYERIRESIGVYVSDDVFLKGFLPHVTIARMKRYTYEIGQLLEKTKEATVSLKTFEVKSVGVFESVLKKEGAKYNIIQHVTFGESCLT